MDLLLSIVVQHFHAVVERVDENLKEQKTAWLRKRPAVRMRVVKRINQSLATAYCTQTNAATAGGKGGGAGHG